MSKQKKADIKQAYQTAAELASIVAVALSKIKENQSIEEAIAKELQHLG
ncbi:hypothetical protein [Iningainema tapete]|uniref:Uncharacterized protein n=1 Tax=Iningainema tapete BLCC-T55 TaxID=2748662 RepID=A0A8J7BWD3_9CYAN|nr:hypothetical protein [Iningainema tapete]MBD2770718.1 hypothetical protein [Iningainema tapete BLCC-T55]